MDNKLEYILCAAIKRNKPHKPDPYYDNDLAQIEIGYRHHDIISRFYKHNVLSQKISDQGFYTSKGRFVNRYEAMEIAYNCGQIPKENAFDSNGKFKMLYSEDLY